MEKNSLKSAIALSKPLTEIISDEYEARKKKVDRLVFTRQARLIFGHGLEDIDAKIDKAIAELLEFDDAKVYGVASE